MDYLENRLNDDVMSIIYKKIHKDKFEDILWNIRHHSPKYGCWRCDTVGFTVDWGDHGNYCYDCNDWLYWSEYFNIPLSKNFTHSNKNFQDSD
jgi:hypothetical protein